MNAKGCIGRAERDAGGGRTSRGSLNNMREYAAFLTRLQQKGKTDLDSVEGFWIRR